MRYVFSAASYRNLIGVRPELVAVATLALQRSQIDFKVTEGLRSRKRQHVLVKEGSSRTLNSRHLTGYAIDVMAIVDGKNSWEWQHYEQLASAFKAAAADLGIALVWGGDWQGFRDGPHFELNRKVYPDPIPGQPQDDPAAA